LEDKFKPPSLTLSFFGDPLQKVFIMATFSPNWDPLREENEFHDAAPKGLKYFIKTIDEEKQKSMYL